MISATEAPPDVFRPTRQWIHLLMSKTNSTPEIVARLAEQLIYDYHEDYYPDAVVSEQSVLRKARDLLDQTLLTDATSDITNKDRALLGSLKAMILEMQRPGNNLANKFKTIIGT